MSDTKIFTFICVKELYDLVKENDTLELEDGTKVKIMWKYFDVKTLQYKMYGIMVIKGENNETTNNRNL